MGKCNISEYGVESPSAGRAQDRAGGSAGEERLCHWKTRVGKWLQESLMEFDAED